MEILVLNVLTFGLNSQLGQTNLEKEYHDGMELPCLIVLFTFFSSLARTSLNVLISGSSGSGSPRDGAGL